MTNQKGRYVANNYGRGVLEYYDALIANECPPVLDADGVIEGGEAGMREYIRKLMSRYDFTLSRAKVYASRAVIIARGEKPPMPGRARVTAEPLTRKSCAVTETQYKLAKRFGAGNFSAGVRQLIEDEARRREVQG